MVDRTLFKAREALANQLLEDFKGKITGFNEDIVVGQNPENKYFVGKLLPNGEEHNVSYSSDVCIESLGADFYIRENQFKDAFIKVFPRGNFYYRIYPTLEQQRDGMLAAVNERFERHYDTFDELWKDFEKEPKELKKVNIRLVPVYKKVDISKNNFFIAFKLSDIMEDDGIYGAIDEKHDENLKITDYLNALQESLEKVPDRYSKTIFENVTIKDLKDAKTFNSFLKINAKEDDYIRQNWRIYIDVRIKKIKDRYLLSFALVNNSQVHSNSITHRSNKKADDKTSIETLFNSGMDIKLEGAEFDPIFLDYFLDDYKYDKHQQAIGTNCSIIFDKQSNTIKTDNLPTFIQNRLITNDKLAVKFQNLIDSPLDTLRSIRKQMDIEYIKWQQYRDQKIKNGEITSIGVAQINKEIEEFNREINRFQFGIDVITEYPQVLKSFIRMNEAFKATSKKYDTWRLFQIVFIVSLIPDIVACDENLMPEDEKLKTTLGDVSLLYFPTGGGKTEAFLGVLVFNLFFDRYRGKMCGVTSILRYPLRLLSVQQVQRLANTLAQAELLRRNDNEIKNTDEFSLGYFVGDGNTPNIISSDEARNLINKPQEEMDEDRVIDICPFCGGHTVHLEFDVSSYRLRHYCDNPECSSGRVLPIYIVDQEIYRYLPSAIISTVDKLAILGNNTNFRSILVGAKNKCKKHGFTTKYKCIVEGPYCDDSSNFEEVEMYDPAPTLFIQDELHLIRESLGTFASHYESFIDYFVKNESPSHRKIKVIGATATISHYESQITQLYRKDAVRFPCASPYPDKNFYAFVDYSDIQRRILGFAPYGKAIVNAVVYSFKYMREVVASYLSDLQKVLDIKDIGIKTKDEAQKILEDYWIFLNYNNVKRDGNNVEGALETPINVELAKENITPFETRKMTGDETFQDVREVLSNVENTKNVFDGINMIIATSMISHGVDADRFNIMFFFGMPGNTAEYIQAYSRTGRLYSSIVVDIIRPSRETDRSYLKNFIKFHEFKDILVESVPINRWANKAIDMTLPGIFTGLLLNKYDLLLEGYSSLFKMKNIKKAMLNTLDKETIRKELYSSYGCLDSNTINDLGNLYKEKIDDFVEKVFTEIVDRAWLDEGIFEGFQSMGFRIMNSLRATDAQLQVELVN